MKTRRVEWKWQGTMNELTIRAALKPIADIVYKNMVHQSRNVSKELGTWVTVWNQGSTKCSMWRDFINSNVSKQCEASQQSGTVPSRTSYKGTEIVRSQKKDCCKRVFSGQGISHMWTQSGHCMHRPAPSKPESQHEWLRNHWRWRMLRGMSFFSMSMASHVSPCSSAWPCTHVHTGNTSRLGGSFLKQWVNEVRGGVVVELWEELGEWRGDGVDENTL